MNERWCNTGHSSVKEKCCAQHIELLVVSNRPSYLLVEFLHIIAITVLLSQYVILMQIQDMAIKCTS